MTPLILILTLLAIAVVGTWGWMHHNRARKLAEERARVENERLAAEARLAHEKIAAEAKAREDARLQAEAEERSRKEAEAIENARLAEEQRLAAEKRAAEATFKFVRIGRLWSASALMRIAGRCNDSTGLSKQPKRVMAGNAGNWR